jgi:class 3 adenylate cyclase
MTACLACGADLPVGGRFCPACGTPAQLALAGEERKLATILFADVTGSTELGEQLDPERLRVLLGSYFAAMAEIIAAWGGTVEKYIGDAIMAVFGVPLAREDDARRALHAAIEMRARLEHLNADLLARHGITLAVRLGITTGEVISPADAHAAGQMLVTGDPVNAAARLEQMAEPGTILVGERTYLAGRSEFTFGPTTALDAKGKARPVGARQLLAVASADAEEWRALHAPMVGRRRELATLTEALDEAVERGAPRMILVLGTAGIGKSRLIREFVAAARRDRSDLRVLHGRCLSAGREITFWPLAEILRDSCGISLDDPADVAIAKLHEQLNQVFARLDLEPVEAERSIRALATSAGLPLPDATSVAGEGPSTAAEMNAAWPLFASAHAAVGPTVLIAEDLHWADRELLAVIDRIVRRAQGPLLVIGTGRPELAEAQPAFLAGEAVSTVWVRPLSEDQGTELVQELLSMTDLDPSVQAGILARAEGNPFFVEELLQGLIDDGRLTRSDGRWTISARPAVLELPDSVHGVLAARIDALPPAEKRLLQEAAVLGRSFWGTGLASAGSELDVPAALEALEARGLIQARSTSSLSGEPEYAFRHALVRDVAYASLPKARRGRAHAEAAAWLETLAGDRVDEFGELIAHHYRAALSGEDSDLAWAGDPEGREATRARAVDALIRAGDVARGRYSERAFDLHSAARELATDDAEVARANESLGDDHALFIRADAALSAYEAALDVARRQGGERSAIVRLATKVGGMTDMFGGFARMPPAERIEPVIDEGLAAVVDEAGRAQLLVKRANMSRLWIGSRMGRLLGQNRPDPVGAADRLSSAREALAIARRLELPGLTADAIDAVAELALLQEDWAGYRSAVQEGLALLPSVTSGSIRTNILFEASRERAEAGANAAALGLARDAVTASRRLSPHHRMHANYALMVAADAMGRWDEVLDLLPEHLGMAAGEPDVSCTAVHGAPLIGARILVLRGASERAGAFAPLQADIPSRIAVPHAALLVSYAMALGAHDLARELSNRILGMPRALQSEGVASVLAALADLGDWEGLLDLLPGARRMADGVAVLAPLADRGEGRARAASGDVAAAEPLLRRALAGFGRLAIPFEVARTQGMLAELGPADASELAASAGDGFTRLGCATA